LFIAELVKLVYLVE